MADINTSCGKFQYSLKLNQLDSNILKFLCNSLDIIYIDNRIELISEIINKLKELENDEFEKFNNLIDEEIKNSKNNKTIIKEEKKDKNDINAKIRPKKRRYIDIENEESKKK